MNEHHSFIKGTAILIFANAVSKILGAVFKIPLTYILQEEGMAIFNTAMGVYTTVLTLAVSGFPLALSRMCAEEYALSNYSGLKKSVRVATALMSVLGIIGTAVMFIFADFFANAMKDPKAGLAIRVIAPSVFFVAWGNVYKSYYQGSVNMIPTAVSQIIEAFVKLAAGIAAAFMLKNAVIGITAAGAISGITIGEIIATLILFGMYIPSVKALPYIGAAKSRRQICKSLASIAVPMLIFSCIIGSVELLDTATVRNGLLKIRFTPESAEKFLLMYSSYTDRFDDLQSTLKLNLDGARWLFGAYSGFALTLFHLPTGIIGALGTGVLPVISGGLAKKDYQLVKKTADTAFRLTMLIAMPSAFVLGFFSDRLLYLLFKNTASAMLLSRLAPCLVFLCAAQLATVILHASGRIFQPFVISMLGLAVKLFANFFLIPIPELNILGAVIGSCGEFVIVMILSLYLLKKHLGISPDFVGGFLKPLAASVLMTIVMLILCNPFDVIFKNRFFSAAMLLSSGGIIYLLAISCLGTPETKEAIKRRKTVGSKL